ncbi:MAG: hypothetical protein MI810_23315 [Flavobacteriales bacterium]|nr:hypothetical protein [Flavobacteriales bacterium]
MKQIIQNNIHSTDSAYDIQLRINLKKTVTNEQLNSIESELDSALMNLGIGFASAMGDDFISASLLDFGSSPTFDDLRLILDKTLTQHLSLVHSVSYSKSEYLQTHYDFVAKTDQPFEQCYKAFKEAFGWVDFRTICSKSDSPINKSFNGSDKDKTIAFYVAEFKMDKQSHIQIAIGSKRLNDLEFDELKSNLIQLLPNIQRVKWNGFNFDHEKEIWKFPKSRKLFEVRKNSNQL